MTKQTAAVGGKHILPPRPRPLKADGPQPPKPPKSRLITLLVFLLAVVGLGLLLYPALSDRYFNWQAQNEIHAYYEYLDVDCGELFAQAEAYNQALAQKEDQFELTGEERDHIATLLNPLGTGMMGYIQIPKIDVRLPIYQGTSESALQAGAGWWVGTSLPTGGSSTHCVLTAHTGLVKAKMFTDLEQLVEGDTFILLYFQPVGSAEKYPQIMHLGILVIAGDDILSLQTEVPFSYPCGTVRSMQRGASPLCVFIVEPDAGLSADFEAGYDV